MFASAGGDLAFVLYGKHTRTWLNPLGAEWRNEAQLGYENLLSSSLYQPLDASHRFFVEPLLQWSQTREDVYVDGDRTAVYDFSDAGAGVDLGVNISNRSQARLGYRYSYRKTRVDTGSPVLPEAAYDDAGLSFLATYDSRDTAFNATRGLAAAVEYLQSDESLGAERDWERAELGVGMALPLRRDVIWLTLAGGSDLGSELPPDRLFTLGGPGSLPGYELGELRAGNYWSASGSYLWKIKDIMSIRGQALYAGVRLLAVQTYDRFDIDGEDVILVDDDPVYGGSLYLTGRTLVGPLTVGVGFTSEDVWSLWLAVGRPVGHGTILEKGIFR
jgi:NTE family protein